MKQTFCIDQTNFSFTAEEDVRIAFSLLEEQEGVTLYRIRFDWSERCSPKRINLSYTVPAVDCYAGWDPIGKLRFLPLGRKQDTESRLGAGMPLKGVLSREGNNAHLIALSDVKSPILQSIRATSSGGVLVVSIDFFTMLTGPFAHYETLLRIDRRRIPFCRALGEARVWFESLGYRNAYVPSAATLPMYSTWYSYGQRITAQDVLRECEAAAKLGMKAVIIDDGWQTERADSIYGYCGDWKPIPHKFPDMKALCDKIHALGMKVMLWFSVPFMGKFVENCAQFDGMYLRELEELDCYVFDPRYRQVRAFLVDLYADAVEQWGLDGLKLDFIDRFKTNGEWNEKMDFVSVEDAVQQLLEEISARLREINPEILIEFRQPYFGPVISAYGNMMRVWDCPLDPVMNRTQSINLRLVSGKCAVHSDMIDWHLEDRPESVALQLWGTLFAVPQISVRLEEITEAQKAVLSRYLSFWTAHRKTLTEGELRVKFTENGYGYAEASTSDESIAILSAHSVLEIPNETPRFYGVNLTESDSIVLKNQNRSPLLCTICDCRGEVTETLEVTDRLTEVRIPMGGMIEISRKNA